jgi:uncharacterized membrane protein YfcA
MFKHLTRKMPPDLLQASRPAIVYAALAVMVDLLWFALTTESVSRVLMSGRDGLLDIAGPGRLMTFAVVITAAFMVRGATGFGSAAIAVPLAALVLPMQFVIPVVTGLQLLSTAEFSARNWRVVDWREISRIAPFLVAGVAMGLYLFYRMDARVLDKGLGLFVMTYALYAMASAGRDSGKPRRLPWPIATILNLTGALVGALFGGASSPFYACYFRALRLSRDAFRASMTMVILMQVVLRIGGYAGTGLFTAATLLAIFLAIPFMLIGGRIGDVVAGRVSDMSFNRFVGIVLLVSGLALAVR